jgi:hypothetical protein
MGGMRLENALLIAAGVVFMSLWEAAQLSGSSDTPLLIGWIVLGLFLGYSVVSGRRKIS